MLINYFLILQAASTIYCYDVEVEGVMKIDKDFIRMLSERSDLIKNLNLPLSFKSKGKLPKKAFGSAVMRAIADDNPKEKSMTDNITPETEQIQECIRHLQEQGNETLYDIGKQIITDLHINMNITSMLKAASEDYLSMMKKYRDVVGTERINSTVDREFIYLDIVETSNRHLYSKEKELLNDIIANQTNTTFDTSVDAMNEKIFKHSVREKKDKMKYICNKYRVCRYYPAFTDYCADLISEILKLTDKKFTTIIVILKKILKENKDFFETVTEKKDRLIIMKKLHSFSTDLFAMKEFFAVLRAVITQRFKAVPSSDNNLKMRTKAMRILLDIVDKALSGDEDLLAIDFDNSVSALRSWASGVREEINGIYEDFAKNLFRIMDFNLTKGARKEMKILIQTIMRDIDVNDISVKTLFMDGSKYVKGDDFHPLIDSLNA